MPLKNPPAWLGRLTAKEEHQRKAAGITPYSDGWYKSIGGATRYLFKPMPLADALALLPGRLAELRGTAPQTIRVAASSLTLEALVEMYLAWLLVRVQTGMPKKLVRRTYDDNVKVLNSFVDVTGPTRLAATLGPSDFSGYVAARLAGRAKSTVRREMIYVDAFLKWAGPGRKGMNLIPVPDVGPDWQKPSEDEITTAAADSDKAYTVAQVQMAFAAVNRLPMLWAAAHLGLNCAFIPRDVALLPESAVNLETATITFPRGKTGVGRLCWLVPNTVQALKEYLAVRPAKCNPSAQGLFFRSKFGLPYARHIPNAEKPGDSGIDYNSLTGQWGKHVGLPFSGLRSTFATWADGMADQRAVDLIMGHRNKGTVRTKHYAKRFDPARARAVAEAVWLAAFGGADAVCGPGRVVL
jgi:integrase